MLKALEILLDLFRKPTPKQSPVEEIREKPIPPEEKPPTEEASIITEETVEENPQEEVEVKPEELVPFITFENYSAHSMEISHLIERILRSYGYPDTRGFHTFLPASGARFLMGERINNVLMLRSNIYEHFQKSREEMDLLDGYSQYATIFDRKMKIILNTIDDELKKMYPRYIGFTIITGRGKPGSYYYVARFY